MLKKKFYAKILYICVVAFAQYLKINDIFAGGANNFVLNCTYTSEIILHRSSTSKRVCSSSEHDSGESAEQLHAIILIADSGEHRR